MQSQRVEQEVTQHQEVDHANRDDPGNESEPKLRLGAAVTNETSKQKAEETTQVHCPLVEDLEVVDSAIGPLSERVQNQQHRKREEHED